MTSRRSLAGNSMLQLQHRRARNADEYGAGDTDSRTESGSRNYSAAKNRWKSRYLRWTSTNRGSIDSIYVSNNTSFGLDRQ
ncbi:hypothetical protein [Xanthomonas campestris]|uniref:hypothetical protein n=1 Tax=Xanthomonas campestris TaxID=339 RepID=UPI001E2A82D6|nr:hypothetical protein [Xanthomonas campestris]MCC5071806.1 hypothetical protein [Xanthomonas campestris pv. plantaginis]